MNKAIKLIETKTKTLCRRAFQSFSRAENKNKFLRSNY